MNRADVLQAYVDGAPVEDQAALDRELRLCVTSVSEILAAVHLLDRWIEEVARESSENEHEAEYLRGYEHGYQRGLNQARSALGHLNNWLLMRAADAHRNPRS